MKSERSHTVPGRCVTVCAYDVEGTRVPVEDERTADHNLHQGDDNLQSV